MVTLTTEQAIVNALPFGACIFIGPELIINAVNDPMLAIWAKDVSVIGKSLYDALPELSHQTVFEEQMNRVYNTGEPFNDPNGQADLLADGQLQRAYFNYSFRPLYHADGHIYGIMNTAINTTSQVLNQQAADRGAEQLRLAIASANLGTWYINSETREFIPSLRLKELFGYHPDEEMPYDAAITQIQDAYRSKVVAAVEAAITQGDAYNLEYPITGFHDQKLRWVKATGKSYPGKEGKDGYFAGTMLDITEQKRDEQRKNDFISMVSHELKTPLTSMGGYVQILQSRASKNGDTLATGMLDKANKQVKKMTTMINGFLNVNRLESGKIHIDKQRFDMAVLMKEIDEEATATIVNHKLIFEPVEETFVLADRDKITQVVNNFISNAAKYSPAGTTIQVACVTRHGEAYVSVQDKGIGIAPQDKDKLFDRFYRAENGQTGTIAGFGIGLYLCKEIIDRHQGQIYVDSQLGQGSTFWFTLPVIQ